MAAVNGVVVNEVLCFIMNKFDKSNCNSLKLVASCFYNDDELNKAKEILHADGCILLGDDFPRLKVRKVSDNRRKLNVDDLVEFVTVLDEQKLLSKLPRYVALNLQRIPTVAVEDVELFVMANKLEQMESRISKLELNNESGSAAVICQMDTCIVKTDELCKQVAALASQIGDMRADKLSSTGHDVSCQPLIVDSAHVVKAPEQVQKDKPSWVDQVVKEMGSSVEPFVIPRAHRKKMLRGRRISGGGLKSVPRRLVCFVGRLDIDTTESELCEYLADVGIKDAICTKLKARDGQKFYTAAFRVSCNVSYEVKFFDEGIWPVGVELRDWVFYKKNGGN
jgi:hypothetical protein